MRIYACQQAKEFFMELRDYIEIGATKAGSLTALGKLLDMSQPRMSHCKAHKERLPIEAVVKLADYIGTDLRALIAANELVTEKKEEKRRFWSPFVEHAKAASFALALTIALVANFVTPTPAEAAQILEVATRTLCIMLSLWLWNSEQSELIRRIKHVKEALIARLTVRTYQVQPV